MPIILLCVCPDRDVAARYLKDLYSEFGDWYLALAAYNCGSSRVKRAMKRDGAKNYWDLHSLPLQTRNYVPNVMAALFIDKNPIKYGFTPNQNTSKMEWHEINIDKSATITLNQLSNLYYQSNTPINKSSRYLSISEALFVWVKKKFFCDSN